MKTRFLRGGLLAFLTAACTFGAVRPLDAEGDDQVRLGIAPLEYSGQYFDVAMAPAESREFKVEVANHGDKPVTALTYAADAYTIVGGGFGARLDSEPATRTTLWLTYAAQTVELPAGKGLARSFSISVPADAAPGEYITSLVVQNATPTSAGTSGVSIRQVHRTAIAIVVTVPGPRRPELAIGAVSHSFFDSNSVISAAVVNTGNVRLKPSGKLVLAGPDGRELADVDVRMDSLYAGDTTRFEATLNRAIPPGDYRVSLVLEHEGGTTRATDLSLNIPEPTKAEAAGAPTAAGAPGAEDPGAGSGSWWIEAWSLPLGATFVVALAAVLLHRVRGRSADRRPRATERRFAPPAVHSDASLELARSPDEPVVIPIRYPLAKAVGEHERPRPGLHSQPSPGVVRPPVEVWGSPIAGGEVSDSGVAPPERARSEDNFGECWSL